MSVVQLRKVFGTDGIRGRANTYPMTPDLIMRVAMAVGIHYRNGHKQRVVIGKDTRLSSYMIENILTGGFLSVGVDVFLLGPVPTPGVAMLTRSLRADYGVMISASHNTYEDNGIKIFGPDGYKLSDRDEMEIEALLDPSVDLISKLSSSEEFGRAKRIDGALERYIEAAKRTLPRQMSFEGLRVVVDCANGAAYKAAPMALQELGAEVFVIGDEPDGLNINRGVGSTAPEALRAKLHEHRADLGIALDGDADRVLIVDEKGGIIDGDQIIAAIVKDWKEEDKLSRPSVVTTVMSNLGLERHFAEHGIELVRVSVGDRYVSERMRTEKINLGGEQSGHIILSDFTTTGDGLIAALQVLAVTKKKDKPASEICRCFDPVPQVTRNVELRKGVNPLDTEPIKQQIESARVRAQGEGGRLVIRKSGTEPLIRVMVEGDNRENIETIAQEVADILRSAA